MLFCGAGAVAAGRTCCAACSFGWGGTPKTHPCWSLRVPLHRGLLLRHRLQGDALTQRPPAVQGRRCRTDAEHGWIGDQNGLSAALAVGLAEKRAWSDPSWGTAGAEACRASRGVAAVLPGGLGVGRGPRVFDLLRRCSRRSVTTGEFTAVRFSPAASEVSSPEPLACGPTDGGAPGYRSQQHGDIA